MRICQMTSVHSSRDVRIFVKQSRSLAAAGHEVFLVAPNERDEIDGGVKILAIPRLPGKFRRMFLSPWIVLRRALSTRADIFHFHDPELIPAALILRLLGKKVICDRHEDLPKSLLSKDYLPTPLRPLLSKFFHLVENATGRIFSAVITATPSIAAAASSKNKAVVQNYPLLEEFNPGEEQPSKEFDFVYIGGISKERGIFEMISALMVLGHKFRPLQLAGPIQVGHFRRRIIESIAAAERAGLLHYHGTLSRPETAKLLKKSRAGIILFHPEPNHLEAVPNKIFEYLSAGLPVLASDFECWKQLFAGQSCLTFVNPLDARAIAAGMETLLASDSRAAEMGLEGRREIERQFNWEAESRKLLAVYESLRT